MRQGVRDSLRPGAKPKKDADDNTGKGYLAESTSDPENLKGRPDDISFVIDHALADSALHADPDRIAVAGHSFGAYTTLAIAGMTVNLPGDPGHSFRDPRVKAGIAMSPQGSGAMRVAPGAWDHITMPVLLLTGTKDYGQGERIAAWRREPFDAIKAAAKNHDAWLMVITDATHMTFATSGRRPLRKNSDEEAGPHQRLILKAVDSFLDTHLKGDAAAMDWLQQAAAGHREDCTVETTEPVAAAKPEAPSSEPAPAPVGK
jgi:predicted dienelactone hydrolase